MIMIFTVETIRTDECTDCLTADVNTFPALNETDHGPTFKFEYSTREAYGGPSGWPADAPLNASFWHGVTVAMETNRSLVSQFNTYQGKSSVKTPNCTNDACAEAKICYMRSGDVALAQRCPTGLVFLALWLW